MIIQGGKWTITMKSNSNLALLDKLWTYLVLGLVGEQIETSGGPQEDEDFVCGAIVATRPRGNRIQIWVKEKDNVEKINALGKRLIAVLEINDHSGVSVEFSVGPVSTLIVVVAPPVCTKHADHVSHMLTYE
jgi:translation initiation factor 4E